MAGGPGKSTRFPSAFGTGSQGGSTRGWKANRGSAGTVHCRVQVQRNGTVAKEAALRWSALTRPVARASGASVDRSCFANRSGAYEFAIARVMQNTTEVPLLTLNDAVESFDDSESVKSV